MNDSTVLEAVIQVRGAVSEMDELYRLLIQNPIFQQLVGGGHIADEGGVVSAALLAANQLKTVNARAATAIDDLLAGLKA